jgi:hypothetical protein
MDGGISGDGPVERAECRLLWRDMEIPPYITFPGKFAD